VTCPKKSWMVFRIRQISSQVRRYGKVRFKLGDHSEEIAFVGDDDSTVRFRKRENMIIAANKISDPAERKEALARVTKMFGRAESSQRTLRTFEGGF
jgi:hypothetical protein